MIDIIIVFVLISVVAAQIYLSKHVEQYAKNNADILQNRKKEYESEKGKNLATKEDVEEITKQIEQVKAEVSFRSQWMHDHVVNREGRLIHIMYLAQKIMMTQNKIIIMSKNAYNVPQLFNIVNELNEYSIELTHEGNMLLVEYNAILDLSPATQLIDTLSKYAGELSCLANNVASCLQGSDSFREIAMKNPDMGSIEGQESIKNSLLLSKQAEAYVTQNPTLKEPSDKALSEYILWLEKKYGEGVLMKYEQSMQT